MGTPAPAVLPDVVPFTVSLSIPDKACARLVQVLAALGTFQTGGVPFQVWRDPKDVLVVDLVPAAHAQRHQPLLWKHTSMPGHKMISSSQELPPRPRRLGNSAKSRPQMIITVIILIVILKI